MVVMAEEVGVLLDEGRVVLLFGAQRRLHGRVQLRALRVQDLALPVCILHASSADLNAALVDGVRLELKAVLLL